MKKALLIILATLLVGCTAHNVQLYSKVDHSNKTVTVPPGSRGLKGKLKQALTQEGWKLAVDRGPSVTEGRLGRDTRIKQYSTFNTRYRLITLYRQYDYCFDFTPAINYEISFIDNYSGSEVFTIDGSGCESAVVEKFKNTLKGIDK